MRTALVKRYIMPALILILGLTVLLSMLNELDRFNYMIVTFGGPVRWQDNNTVAGNLYRYADCTLFSRTEDVYITDCYDRYAVVSVYNCSQLFFDITRKKCLSGRFLWDIDAVELSRFAVIDSNLAVLFFGGYDCIGCKINVGGQEYSVVGVCEAEDGLLTSVDEYAVYLPMDSYTASNSQGGCLLRSDNDVFLYFAIQKGILPTIKTESRNNLKVRSAMWAAPARVSLVVIWIMALVGAIKVVRKYAVIRINQIRAELDDLYPREYIKKHYIGILLHIAAFLLLCGLFALWFKAVSFKVTIEAAIVPRNLIDVEEWLKNITAYMRNRNSSVFIPFSSSLQIPIYGKIAAVASVFVLYASRKILLLVRSWLNKALDNLDERLNGQYTRRKHYKAAG